MEAASYRATTRPRSKVRRQRGIRAALMSALFLGMAPVFGKQAILFGFSPLAIVALRTGIATLLISTLMAIFKRRSFYIYPVGFFGCLLAGIINGLGSILYYAALSRLDASIGQLLYSFYPIFVAMWLMIDQQPVSRITLIRLGIAIPGMYLLLSTGSHRIDLIGATMMFGSAVLYALHLLINQRVLYEVPAQTVTLYTLVAMSGTVLIVFLIFNPHLPKGGTPWWPVIGMALVTFLSRLMLFSGIKNLGGMQTALLGLGELLVTVSLAISWLGEYLTWLQWIGAGLLICSMLMVGLDRHAPDKRHYSGWLAWLNSPIIRSGDLPWQPNP